MRNIISIPLMCLSFFAMVTVTMGICIQTMLNVFGLWNWKQLNSFILNECLIKMWLYSSINILICVVLFVIGHELYAHPNALLKD